MNTHKRTPAEVREDCLNAFIIFVVFSTALGVFAWFKS